MNLDVVIKVVLLFGCLPGSDQFDSVVFTVGQNTHLNLTDATTIPFTKTLTNHNAVNDINGGVFRCTVDDLYKFQVYALTKTGTNLYLELYQNSDLVASLWAHTPNDYAAAGNAVILNLKYGDTVQVKSHSSYPVEIFGTNNQMYTTFSGVQLGHLYNAEIGISHTAFSVALNQHQDVAGGAPVLYNTKLVDIDDAYNNSTGSYRAPSDGIYIFHYFSLARNNKELWQELYHNGDYVCSIYALTNGDWADAGNTAILHLKAGDQVIIKARGGRPNTLYGSTDQIYSTFSGTQLKSGQDLSNSHGDEPVVAFSAGLSHDLVVNADTKVIFDRTFLDLRSSYNHITGEFTAPLSGFYEFNYHALGITDKPIYLQLYHNYHYVDSLYSHTPGQYAAAGNSAVLELDTGDIVFVKAEGANSLYGRADQVYCTFSGYLMHSTDNAIVVGK